MEKRWPLVFCGANDGVAVPPDRDSRRGFNSLYLHPLLSAPPVAGNCGTGLCPRDEPRTGFAPAVILALLARRKQGQNDVHSLPASRMQEVLNLWTEESPEMALPIL